MSTADDDREEKSDGVPSIHQQQHVRDIHIDGTGNVILIQQGTQSSSSDLEKTKRDTQASTYPSELSKKLAERLMDLYDQREQLAIAKRDTGEIEREILAVRRQQRHGPELQHGEILRDGRFKLIEQIGHGGLGSVWRAYDRKEHENVAIKVLHGPLSQERRERFYRGARRMAKLRHLGIVRVLEQPEEEDGFHYFVMEYVAGGDLNQAVLAGHVDVKRGLDIIQQVGAALAYAHSQGVLHRDVKPANILLRPQGACLTDFDLAWAADTTGGTGSGPLGTFIYTAPELLKSAKDPSPQVDVFSLGMTTLFVLHGRALTPDAFRDPGGLIDHLASEAPVKSVIRRALDWHLARRFPSVADFCKALSDAAAGLTEVKDAPLVGSPADQMEELLVLAAKYPYWYRPGPRFVPQRVGKRPLTFWLLLLLVLLSAGLGASLGLFTPWTPPS